MQYAAILFLAGLLGPVKLQFGGDIFFPDLFLIACFLFLFRRLSSVPGKPYIRLLVALGGLWLLSQIITDIVRQTPFEDWSRGWAKIVFFVADLLGLVAISRLRLERISTFIAGLSVGTILQTLFFPNDFQADLGGQDFAGGPWKFGLGPSLTTLAAIFGATPLSRRLFGGWAELAPLSFMGVANLAFNSRSVFGSAMAAVAYGAFKRHLDRFPRLRRRFGPGAFLALILGGYLFGLILVEIYSMAAANDWLGDRAREKYELQTSGNISLLQAGRMESLVSTRAIADSPILGHGSWAKDPEYGYLLQNLLEERGVKIEKRKLSEEGEGLIPAHSHLLGAWVEAGVMGAVFWTAVAVLSIMAIYRCLKRPGLPAAFLGLMFFSLFWDVLFSPFANSQRFVKAAQICLIIRVLDQEKSNKAAPRLARPSVASATISKQETSAS